MKYDDLILDLILISPNLIVLGQASKFFPLIFFESNNGFKISKPEA